jgi:hypothetical protein
MSASLALNSPAARRGTEVAGVWRDIGLSHTVALGFGVGDEVGHFGEGLEPWSLTNETL